MGARANKRSFAFSAVNRVCTRLFLVRARGALNGPQKTAVFGPGRCRRTRSSTRTAPPARPTASSRTTSGAAGAAPDCRSAVQLHQLRDRAPDYSQRLTSESGGRVGSGGVPQVRPQVQGRLRDVRGHEEVLGGRHGARGGDQVQQVMPPPRPAPSHITSHHLPSPPMSPPISPRLL